MKLKRKSFLKIAIDSPAAAGAGTQAKLIAKHYSLLPLDTGKCYRFIANIKLTEHDINIKGQKLKFSNDGLIKEFFPTIDIVKKNIKDFSKTNIENVVLIKGDVHKTLNDFRNIPEKISFLRLDTDLYSTTKLQLEILFPKLVSGGVLHIDDYGFFPGVRKAVDDYFKNSNIWLHRVDLTCRLLIKE